MRNNEKIRVIDGEPIKFAFKPPIGGIKNKKTFLEYMQRHSHEGLGGVRKEAIIESLPKAEKILKHHEEKQNIYIHHRPDKKVLLQLKFKNRHFFLKFLDLFFFIIFVAFFDHIFDAF